MGEDNQIAYVKELASTLAGDGHQIDYLDLLDYLAIHGLRLTKDLHGDASAGYFHALLDLNISQPRGGEGAPG